MELKEKLQQMQYWAQCSIKIYQEYAPYLNINDQEYITYSSHQHIQSNPKGYYIIGILDEIAKIGSSMFRWIDFISGDELSDQHTFPTRSIIQAVSDEQQMWKRKLLEANVDLILFNQTNEIEYYRHHLLLKEYNVILSVINDWNEFYGCPFENYLWQRDQVQKEILKCEKKIELKNCWYLYSKESILSHNGRGNIFRSFRQKLKQALTIANAREKLALGLSYKRYSDTSESIHFNPEKRFEFPSTATIENEMMKIWMTVICVVGRIQKIIGLPEGFNDEFNSMLKLPTNEHVLLSRLVEDRFQINDIILTANSDLAIVIDLKTSNYGYKMYKFRYLIKEPLPGIKEEWLPGNYLKSILRYKDHMKQVTSNPEFTGFLKDVPEQEYYEHFVNIFIKTWNLGAKDYFLKNDPNAIINAFMKLDS